MIKKVMNPAPETKEDMQLQIKQLEDTLNAVVSVINEGLETDKTKGRYGMIRKHLPSNIKQYGSNKLHELKRVDDESQTISLAREVADRNLEHIEDSAKRKAITEGEISLKFKVTALGQLALISDESVILAADGTIRKNTVGPGDLKMLDTTLGSIYVRGTGLFLGADKIVDFATRKVENKLLDSAGRVINFITTRVDNVIDAASKIKAATQIVGKPDNFGTQYDALKTTGSWAAAVKTYCDALNDAIVANGGGDSGDPPAPPLADA